MAYATEFALMSFQKEKARANTSHVTTVDICYPIPNAINSTLNDLSTLRNSHEALAYRMSNKQNNQQRRKTTKVNHPL